jgi:Mrp family chromosome partitioning ATPase
MSKTKDALDLARDLRQEISDNDVLKGRKIQDMPLRRPLPQKKPPHKNLGEEWIASLHFLRATATEDPNSRVMLGEKRDERAVSAYKMLRTRTLARMRQNDWHIIGVTSPGQGDGKSLTSLNLALSLAREQTLSVVLAELDLRRSSVCQHLGVDPVRGLPDFLEGKAKLESVLFRPAGTERIAVLPNTEIYENSSETLSSPLVADLIEQLRGDDKGRIVICDLPPYLVTDDVLAFTPLVDAFLIVVNEGSTPRDVLKKGLDILRDMPILGVVLNRSDEATSGYYY